MDDPLSQMLVNEICECIDKAEENRVKKSRAGKKGMEKRYNPDTDTTESQDTYSDDTAELQDTYNSDTTQLQDSYNYTYTKTNTKTKNNKNTDTKTEKYIMSGRAPVAVNGDDARETERFSDEINEIVEYLNEKTGKHYSPKAEATRKHIRRRMEDGYTVDDFRRAIDNKTAQWLGTDMERYLRPTTLFNSEKFEGYANEVTPMQEPKTKMREDCEKIMGWLERRQQRADVPSEMTVPI